MTRLSILRPVHRLAHRSALWLALALSGLAAAACSSDSGASVTQDDIVCPTDSTLTYANFGSILISDNCLGCHRTTLPVLSSQAQVMTAKNGIINAAVLSTRMPRGGSLTIDERQMLGQWLNCGAP